MCKVEGAAVHRHDTIRDGVVPDRAILLIPIDPGFLANPDPADLLFQNYIRITVIEHHLNYEVHSGLV